MPSDHNTHVEEVRMSQIANVTPGGHRSAAVATHVHAHRPVVLAALLALVATAALLLVLALSDDPPTSSVADRSQPALRSDGGPGESAVAAAIGSQAPAVRPDESAVAAAIGSAAEQSPTSDRPDESVTAAVVSGR
jgi:hypothetical protein